MPEPQPALLPPAEVDARLTLVPGWAVVEGRLHRDIEFPDFTTAFSFMTAVALEAQRLDHHPDWSNSWNRVSIDIVSHHAGGITPKCFELVEAIQGHIPADG